MHYLDNAATTPVVPEVIQVVSETLAAHFANPSSLYRLGFKAEREIDKSRKEIAKALGCTWAEVIFTASGTESNNIALLGAAAARKGWGSHLVTTGYEHPSVIKPLERLALEEGFSLAIVAPGADGTVDIDEIVKAVRGDTALVAAMQVNNETGAIIDVAALAEKVKAKNPRTAVHVDGVQGFTRLPLRLAGTKIDSYAVSGHKLHAPKGVGALYLRKGYTLHPPMLGGGQENALRPGTENTAYIVGFAKAVALAGKKHIAAQQTTQQLQQQLLQGLAALPGVVVNSPAGGYAGIVNFSLPGVRSETMLHFLEERSVYVSSGSACNKGGRSHTLSAMNLPDKRIDCALRVSFSGENTPADVEALLAGLQAGLGSLARPK
ncbi:cysteine desulfurase [Ruminococcaceae bacterium OttesenSCG-928-A16]|nr:cysteine desulfurase [Ruminococcaceae bacterium OttesenSCG-928-A16]